MDERLKAAGFRYMGVIHCSCPYKMKYQRGGVTAYLNPKKPNTLKIKSKLHGVKILRNEADFEAFLFDIQAEA